VLAVVIRRYDGVDGGVRSKSNEANNHRLRSLAALDHIIRYALAFCELADTGSEAAGRAQAAAVGRADNRDESLPPEEQRARIGGELSSTGSAYAASAGSFCRGPCRSLVGKDRIGDCRHGEASQKLLLGEAARAVKVAEP
jgi:hypothetical protein